LHYWGDDRDSLLLKLLGRNFSDEFDPKIKDAIDKIKSCIKSSDLDDDGPSINRVK
jgi:hypothetical protein